jgi:hypothetical protein
MSAEFGLLLIALRAVEDALEAPGEMPGEPPLKCQECDDWKAVYQYPMDEEYGQECLGDQCTRKGGCDRA